MVPRADIVAVQQDITLGELVMVFAGAGHSRLVVYNDTLDDPTGMVHIRDLVAFMAARAAIDPAAGSRATRSRRAADLDLANIDLSMPLTAAKIVREILYAPPSMPALDLLAKMQATRIHLALVIDEYGGSDGLVSIEDLVELIVGDIADEHDEAETPAVTRQSDGSFLATGRASLDDVRAVIGEEFDVGEAAQEVDTLGGYLVMQAGHVPVRGELVPGPRAVRSRSARCRSAPGQARADLPRKDRASRCGARTADAGADRRAAAGDAARRRQSAKLQLSPRTCEATD